MLFHVGLSLSFNIVELITLMINHVVHILFGPALMQSVSLLSDTTARQFVVNESSDGDYNRDIPDLSKESR